MKFVQYICSNAIIFIIGFIILCGIIEKKDVFKLFIDGVIEGEKIVIDLIPVWLGLFVSIGMLKSSGFIDFISNVVCFLFSKLIILKEIIPLIFLRPISGSTSTAMGIEILKNVGVDSNLGILTSCIMGSTETTIYVVALYTSKLKDKNIKPVIIIGLIGDLMCVLFSIIALKIGII